MIFFANGNAPSTDNDIRLLCRLRISTDLVAS